MYTESSIDRIRDVNIEELIGKYVELKKSGSNFKGFSPFTDEKTPSFMVSPQKQIFKDFASGHGGDGIKFVMLFERVEFYEAIKIIAEKSGVYLEHQEMSADQKQKLNTRQELKKLSDSIARQYAKQLKELPENHWAKKMISERGYSEETIIDFQLGFAPRNLVSPQAIQHAKLELAKEIGVVKSKTGSSYDFFQERLIFPIHDRNGQVLSFGGRRSNAEDQKNYAKYLNGSDSEIYKKSNVLFALHQAYKAIAKSREVYLVEGYTDAISMHQAEINNTVATCGTSLTESHSKQLNRIADNIILFRDGDDAGLKAAERDIKVLLPTDSGKISIVIAPEGEDPDSLSRSSKLIDFLKENTQDAIFWLTDYKLLSAESSEYKNALDAELEPKELKKIRQYDIAKKAQVIEDLLEVMSLMPSAIKRNEYLKVIAKKTDQKFTQLKGSVASLLSAQSEKEKNNSANEYNGLAKKEMIGFPEGGNVEEYKERGFVSLGNEFWMKTKKEGWTWVTNFKMTPLFHIKGGSDDTPRLFDVISNHEPPKRALVEITSSEVLNFTALQNKLLNYGTFRFNVCTDTLEFKTIMVEMLEQCIEAKPFYHFGWQNKGFWAFANGIYLGGKFHEVNKYGIVVAEGLEEIDSEYYDNTPNYYSPAFNEANKYTDEDNDEFENDRTVIFKESPVSFNRWMEQLVKVYKQKGNIGIGFAIGSMFRDLILSRYSFFPHLYLTGEKGSGKSKFGDSISNLFFYKLTPFDLNSGTLVGFYRRLARIKNAPTFFEEYHDKIDDRMFQSLKGAFDGRGREKGMATDNNRTQISKINTSCIIASQYNSIRDDNSLTIRSLTWSFIKPSERTNEEVEDFNLLKKWEEEGLSSLVLEVIKYRKLMEQNFHGAFSKNGIEFKKALEGFEYQERILNNYNAIYTPVQILFREFNFPFSLEEYFTQCVNAIIDNSDLLVESEGLSDFWNIVQSLFEEKYHGIKRGLHFDIDKRHAIKIQVRKGEQEDWQNSNRCNILFLRLNQVHQKYADVASKRDGTDVIGEGSLRNNFKSKRYYIGAVKGHSFSRRNKEGKKVRTVSSCYAFDYDMMKELGMINLDDPEVENELDGGEPSSTILSEEEEDDIPY